MAQLNGGINLTYCHHWQIVKRVRESLAYIGELEPSVRATVIDAYADSVHVTQWFTATLTACALVASFFIKEKQLAK